MAVYFVLNSAIMGTPSDSTIGVANGRDAIGFALVNATYDHTGNGEGERYLSLAAAFASYSFIAGDLIYLLNAIGGVADGLYEIASRVDDDAILLVADSGLTADSTGDIDSAVAPWATPQFALDTIAAADEIRLCADANFLTNSVIDDDITSGAAATPINIRGANARGLLDGTRATIKAGDSFPGSTYLVHSADDLTFHFWHDIIFDAAPEIGGTAAIRCFTNQDTTTDAAVIRFHNCDFKNSSSHGVEMGGTTSWSFYECEFFDNGGQGIRGLSGSRGIFQLRHCSTHDNASDGASVARNGSLFSYTDFYGNGGNGLLTSIGYDALKCRGCNFIANGADGLEASGSSNRLNYILLDNFFGYNAIYGLHMDASNVLQRDRISNNHSHNNASGHTSSATSDADWTDFADGDNTFDDPLLVSIVDGSEDFEPQSGSPLLNVSKSNRLSAGGSRHWSIGSHNRDPSAGGVTTIIKRPRRIM